MGHADISTTGNVYAQGVDADAPGSSTNYFNQIVAEWENPAVPKVVFLDPYWGPIDQTPAHRRLRENQGEGLPLDEDVERIWWPDLKLWIDQTLLGRQ